MQNKIQLVKTNITIIILIITIEEPYEVPTQWNERRISSLQP